MGRNLRIVETRSFYRVRLVSDSFGNEGVGSEEIL